MDIYTGAALPAKDHPVKGPAYRIAAAIPLGQRVTDPPPVSYAHHYTVDEPVPGTPETDAILRLLSDIRRTDGATRYIIYPDIGPTAGIEALTSDERCTLFGIGCPES